MMRVLEPICLATLGEGAAEELFQRELARVLDNIRDPNTQWKKPRKVVLELTIQPDEERQVGTTVIACTSKLAPTKGNQTTLYMGFREGRLVAVEQNPKQLRLDVEPAGPVAIGAREED